MKKKESKLVSSIYRDKKYKINKGKLSSAIVKSTTTDFEKHLIQEGVKQILFGEGTECLSDISQDVNGYPIINSNYRKVPDEMILFLLDCDVIEEIKS